MQETQETRAKLANALRDLESSGQTEEANRLVEAYKRKYKTKSDTGVSYNADQQALATIKANREKSAQEDQATIDATRQKFGDTAANVVDKVNQYSEGLKNLGTRRVGGLATYLNSKLGFSDNPALKEGTASNKYIMNGMFDEGEGAFKSTTPLGKAGELSLGATELIGTSMAGTGAANLLSKGVTATNIGRTALQSSGFASKAIPLATAALGNAAVGSGASTIQNGGYQGDFAVQTGLNIGVPILGRAVGAAFNTALGRTISNQINKAAQSTDKKAIQDVFSTSAGKRWLTDKGIRVDDTGINMDDVKAVAQKELAGVREKLTSLPLGQSKAEKLQAILAKDTDDGALATFTGNLSNKTNNNNAFDSSETIDNINDYITKIYDGNRISEAITSLGKRADLPLNKIPVDQLKTDMLGAIEHASLDADEKIIGRNLVEKYFNKDDMAQIASGQKSRLEFLNNIRLASNKKYAPDEINARLILGDEVRKYFDSLLDTADTSKLSQEAYNEWKAIKLSNKYFADAQNAKKIAQAINNVSVGGRQGLTRMIGGIIATGGSYNPFAYAAGTIAADALHGVTNRALNQNIFKHGVHDILDYTGNQIDVLDQLTSHLKPRGEYVGDTMKILTRKQVANPTQLMLPAPAQKPTQSLRDEILGTLKKK